MRRILLPVDGSLESLEAVGHAIVEARAPEGVEVHLLNVQPRTIPEESMVAIPVEDLDTYYYRRSIQALECAERCLHDAGVNFVSHHAVGPVAESILEKQRELGCDSILMSTHGHGRVASALLGSVSARVVRSASVPVVLVRARPVPDFTGRLGAT
jgi:nucleotide-binding universal stress UspA family protein